jgi:DNA-binding NarL/FixJ family response regulator
LINQKALEAVMHAITPASTAPQLPEHLLSRGADPMKTLLIGRHFLIREALRAVLKELKNDAVVLEALDGQEAIGLLSKQADVSLIILDLDLPDGSGLSALGELRERHPGIPVIIISGAQDYSTIVRALNLGARGFILKSEKRQIMLGALELVFAGGIYIPREVLALESSSVRAPAAPRGGLNGQPAKLAELGLTGRQLDVLKAMMKGKGNKAICRELNLAEPTVKNHVTAILRQLGVHNRVEAVLAMGALGWPQQEADDKGVPRQNAEPTRVVRLPDRLFRRG